MPLNFYSILLFVWSISFNVIAAFPSDTRTGDSGLNKKIIYPNNNNSEEDTLVSVLWTSVKRHPNKTDLIRPSLCPSPCDRLFKARQIETSEIGMDDGALSPEELCQCRCPTTSPVFMQSVGRCISSIDGCRHPIKVSSTNHQHLQFVPVIILPKKNEFIHFPGQILWQESRVKVKPKEGPRCNITIVRVLRQKKEWEESTGTLFKFGWSDELNTAGLIWTGSEDERESLFGSLIQIQMNCVRSEPNSHCLTVRISGELVFPNHGHQVSAPSGNQNRVETAVIILLAILLFFTSFGYFILWKIRWRIKKSKLISALQMQFIYHMKQEKESSDYHIHHHLGRDGHHYQMFNALNPVHVYGQKSSLYPTNDSISGAQAETTMHTEPSHNSTLIAKRKLYFSVDFFDPHLMQNPPPMADEFLRDLRKMIDIAKQRINLRKHVQHLGPIAEEPSEIYQHYMKCSRREPLLVKSSSSVHFNNDNRGDGSPNSIDSGHESSGSNETKQPEQKTSNGEGQTSKSGPNSDVRPSELRPPFNGNTSPKKDHQERPPTLHLNTSQITSSIQHEFKKATSDLTSDQKLAPHVSTPNALGGIQIHNGLTVPSSRIPIMSVAQKSPRIASKPLTLSNYPAMGVSQRNQEEPPPLPARNPPSQPTRIVQQFIAQQQQNSIQPRSEPSQNGRTSEVRRKAYAVFPQNGMLKKSLPRRSKKPPKHNSNSTTSNKNGVIETNM